MGTRRRYLFVLLFVLGLVGVSLLVIASKPTKLGLDLKGGVELVYQGQPTGQVKEVTGEDIERSIEIIRERIDQFGVSEPEVSRLGEDQITVSLPDVDNAQRAIDQVGTTAQLFFYDWEPSLIGPEKAIGGRPGQQPPAGPLKASEERWKEAGRDPKSIENEQLVFAGAYPNAYGAALLASEQEPDESCENCSVAKPRYYLFQKQEPHDLIAGPELAKKDLYVSATGEKRSRDGLVLEVPPGTIVVSEYPTDQSGTVDKTTKPGWYAIKDDPALSGTDLTDPKL
jgi:SecD/SecF fusion protein